MQEYTKIKFKQNKYDIAGTQAYFTKMAGEGLIVDSVGSVFATYSVETPRLCHYRLEPPSGKFHPFKNPAKRPTKQQQDLYEEYGWRYVTTVAGFYLYRCDDPIPVELHTEPETQKLSYALLKKKSLTDVLASTILVLLYGKLLWQNGFVALVYPSNQIFAVLLVTIVYGSLFFYTVNDCWQIRAIYNRLAEGLPLEETRAKSIGWVFSQIRCVVILPLCLVMLFTSVERHSLHSLEEAHNRIAMVWLEEVENNLHYQPLTDEYARNWDRNNRIGKREDMFHSGDYYVYQKGQIEGETNPDGTPYQPRLYIERKEKAPLLFQDRYFKEMMQYNTPQLEQWAHTILQDTPFDRAELYEREGEQVVGLQSGRMMVLFRYEGRQDITDWIDSFPKEIEKMKENEKAYKEYLYTPYNETMKEA